MSLKPWKLDDPFERVIRHNLNATVKISASLDAALRLCSSKYKHLLTIWARLAEEVARINANMEILNKLMQAELHSSDAPKSKSRAPGEAETIGWAYH